MHQLCANREMLTNYVILKDLSIENDRNMTEWETERKVSNMHLFMNEIIFCKCE